MRYLISAIFLFTATRASAQNVKVQLDVDDSGTGGLIRGTIAAALRSLGDVTIVGSDESPDYRIHALAMCQPERTDCSSATSYVGYFGVAETASLEDARVLVELGRPAGSHATQKEISTMHNYLSGYEIPRLTWAFAYGTARYEQALRELVRRADALCFERIRIRRAHPDASYVDLVGRWQAAGATCSASD